MRKQLNIRIPDLTEQQIAAIMKHYGISKTEVVILAVDRLERSMRRKRAAEKGSEK